MLQSLPTVCLNLGRRHDRRAAALSLKKDLGLKQMRFMASVDGRVLLKSGGRARNQGSRHVMSWGEPGKERRTFHICGGTGAKKGVSNIWSLLGRTLSHINGYDKLLRAMD